MLNLQPIANIVNLYDLTQERLSCCVYMSVALYCKISILEDEWPQALTYGFDFK